MNKTHTDKFTKARTRMILSQHFFGALALKLIAVPSPKVKTMATDGRRIWYNPTWTEALTMSETQGVIAHEVMHCALTHHTRRGNRDPERWNVACDYAINLLLKDAGITLPGRALLDEKYRDMSAEQIFNLLKNEPPKPDDEPENDDDDDSDDDERGNDDDGDDDGDDDAPGGDDDASDEGTDDGDTGNGDDDGEGEGEGDASDGTADEGTGNGDEGDEGDEPGKGAGNGTSGDEGDEGGTGAGELKPDPNAPPAAACVDDKTGTGVVIDAPAKDGGPATERDMAVAENDWKIATVQAAQVATMAGSLPGSLMTAIDDMKAPLVDWREVLRDFITRLARNDYSWTTPNRRLIGSGMYLPGMRSEEIGPLVLAIDSSGSTSHILANFVGEVNAILEDLNPELVHVIQCDTRVTDYTEYTADDLPLELEIKGGGGTRFKPVFDRIEELDEEPACVVFFTDMAPFDWDELTDPGVPVLWADYDNGRYVPDVLPFGEHVAVDVDAT